MAWTNSKIFYRTLLDSLGNTTAMDLDVDVPKVSLHNTSVTPDQTVAAAASAFNTGVWVTANEVTDATGWPSGGRPLVSATFAMASNVVTYDAADTASANSTTTLAAVFGALVYDDTLTTPVADQGLCYNYFGGTQSVTAGLFTIVWAAAGIFGITL